MTRVMKPTLPYLIIVVTACAASSSSPARYPGAPPTFDRAAADPKALAIADKAFAAAGGSNWDHAKQLRWHETVMQADKVAREGEEAWDRVNARHYGRLVQPGGDVVVGYDLYGGHAMGYMQHGEQHMKLDADSRDHAIAVAKTAFETDTALLTLPFLMLEPGTKLAYVGPAGDDDELAVTFGDPLRTDELHVFVARATSLISRVEIVRPGSTQRTGYALDGWTVVAGMKFATTRKDLGDPTVTTTIKDLAISEPTDSLFIAPL